MKKLIALTDDEPDIVELISLHLEKAGYKVRAFYNGSSFLKFLEKTVPDLVILDLMLPDTDGFEICRLMKKKERTAAVPLIMLTAKSGEMDKVLGLELGADDYVTKPFSPKELVARVKAMLRRNMPGSEPESITVGDMISIDIGKHEVLMQGQKVDLTSTEFKILEFLASKKGWVFSREKILDHLWGPDKEVIDRTIDVHIRHMREKMGPASKYIKNIRSIGYKLED